jgi:hypothetical protein
MRKRLPRRLRSPMARRASADFSRLWLFTPRKSAEWAVPAWMGLRRIAVAPASASSLSRLGASTPTIPITGAAVRFAPASKRGAGLIGWSASRNTMSRSRSRPAALTLSTRRRDTPSFSSVRSSTSALNSELAQSRPWLRRKFWIRRCVVMRRLARRVGWRLRQSVMNCG